MLPAKAANAEGDGASAGAARRRSTATGLLDLARQSESAAAFFTRALEILGDAFSSPYAALYIRLGPQVHQHDTHRGPGDPNFWKPAVQSFLTEALAGTGRSARLLRSRDGDAKIAFLSAPLRDPAGGSIGVVVLVATAITEEAVPVRLAQLDAAAEVASAAVALIGAGQTSARKDTSAPGQAMSHAGQAETAEELAFTITNSLRNRLGCQQAALGLVARRRVNIISISGLDHVEAESAGVRRLQAAMEECLDAGRAIAAQPAGSSSDQAPAAGYKLHEQWSAAVSGDAVASLPLRDHGRIVAILSLRQRANGGFTAERLEEIRTRVEPYASALLLLRRARRGLLQHARDRLNEGAVALLGPGNRAKKAAAGLVVVFLVWFFGGSLPYTLLVPATLVPAEMRHVTAPFDGVLLSSAALEGDTVAEGGLLCRLDRRELEEQRAELSAELAVLDLQEGRAMAANQPVERQLAQASQRLTQARLEIVERRLAQCDVLAPLAGTVIAGDLRKRVSGPVTRGETLFEIAPAGRWRIDLQIPEGEADEVFAGLTGTFAANARPEAARAFRIKQVSPEAEVRGPKNVVIAEAAISVAADWARPGMEGMARIDAGKRRVWWIALHRVLDYLRLHVLP